MFQIIDPLHEFMDIAAPLAIAGGSWVLWMVKAKVQELHIKNEKAVANLKEVLLEHLTKTASDLRVHQAVDEGNFKEIRSSLDRIDKKLDTKT